MSRPARLDRLCAEAVELARAAAEETGEGVGEYLHAEPEADRVVTHFFDSTLSGYRGWRWAVVVARAPRSRTVTVNETALLPGPDALTGPDWVPWAERLRAGDVGVGDLLPTDESDTRLMPAYAYSDDDAVEEIAYELGVGRTRVMSREGRIDTAERWYDGEQGPNAEIATSAPAEARCGSCGFYLPLAGSLRQLFGVCGNMYATDDARAVSADHGCGAHSEVLTQIDTSGAGLVDHTDTAYDDALIEQIDTSEDDDEDDAPAAATEDEDDTPAEATTVDEPEAKRDTETPEPEAASEAVTVEVADPATDAATAVEVTESTQPESARTDVQDAAASVAVETASERVEAPAEVTVTVPQDESIEVIVEETEAPAADPTVTEPVATVPEQAAEAIVDDQVEAPSTESDDTPEPAVATPAEPQPATPDTPTADNAEPPPATEDESAAAPESSQVSPAADADDSGHAAP